MTDNLLFNTAWLTFAFFLAVDKISGDTCWDSPWYNTSSPSQHAGSEFEKQNQTVLNKLCQNGGPVIDAHCKDARGEPFRGFKNDTANHYIATCNITVGLECHPYNNISDAKCADFSIQYGCLCPKTTGATTRATAVTSTPVSRILATSSIDPGAVTVNKHANLTASGNQDQTTDGTAGVTAMDRGSGTGNDNGRGGNGEGSGNGNGEGFENWNEGSGNRDLENSGNGSGESSGDENGEASGNNNGESSEKGQSRDGQNSALDGNQCICRNGGESVMLTTVLIVVMALINLF